MHNNSMLQSSTCMNKNKTLPSNHIQELEINTITILVKQVSAVTLLLCFYTSKINYIVFTNKYSIKLHTETKKY